MRRTVLLIPKDRRDEIISKNIIANAVPLGSNAYMKFLFVLWYNYIEPNGQGSLDCSFCLQNVLGNFKAMQDTIIELHKEEQLLEL